MSIPQNPQGGGSNDESRVRCLYCGASNFDSSPTCWQCHRPLQPLRPQQQGQPSPMPPPSASSGFAASQPRAAAAYSRTTAAVDMGLATKAAALLGLMFPFFGLPIGMVFLMLDDARKTQIGWITIGWSIAGSIMNAIGLLALLGPALAALKGLVPGGAHGGLPSLPSMGGDSDLNILTPIISAFLHHQ